jgi:hypothetical protein
MYRVLSPFSYGVHFLKQQATQLPRSRTCWHFRPESAPVRPNTGPLLRMGGQLLVQL